MYETVKLVTTIAFFALVAICVVMNIMKKKKIRMMITEMRN